MQTYIQSYDNAFFTACELGHLSVVKFFLGTWVPHTIIDGIGRTGLMLAAKEGSVDVVKLLLAAGASVDYQNKRGWNALMYACAGGHVEVVRLLIALSANLDARNEDGQTALHVTCRKNLSLMDPSKKLAIVKVLLEGGINDHINDHWDKKAIDYAREFDFVAEVVAELQEYMDLFLASLPAISVKGKKMKYLIL